jgi:Raf kinase inhibitor-like YbhB/YbcL family protein
MEGNRLIWIVTVLAVIGILGVSVAVSRQYRAPVPPPQAPAQPAPVVQAVPPAAAPESAPAPAPAESLPLAAGSAMKLAGDVRGPGGKLPLRYTCFRQNISPAFSWQGVPAGAKSLALVLERRDKDEKPVLHWAVFDIPPALSALPGPLAKTAAPAEGLKQAASDAGSAGYSGPCEREGEHDYVFRLFALDTVTGLQAGAPGAGLMQAMQGHVLAEADLPVIHYYRK